MRILAPTITSSGSGVLVDITKSPKARNCGRNLSTAADFCMNYQGAKIRYLRRERSRTTGVLEGDGQPFRGSRGFCARTLSHLPDRDYRSGGEHWLRCAERRRSVEQKQC